MAKKTIQENTANMIYDFISQYREEKKKSPSTREICKTLGLKSTTTVDYYIDILEKQGRIRYGNDKYHSLIPI